MTVQDAQVLESKFGKVAQDEEFQSECLNLMKQFALNAEDLFWKWESYVLNRGSPDIEVSCQELKNLQEYLIADLEKENRSVKKPRLSLQSSARKNVNVNSPESFLDSMLSTPASRKRKQHGGVSASSSVQQTPSRLRREVADMDKTPVQKLVMMDHSQSPAASSTPYRSRKDAGKTLETLNEKIVDCQNDRQQVPTGNVSFQLNVDLKKYNYRTMRMKLTETAEYFDDKIETLIDQLIKSDKYQITDEHIGNAALLSQSEIVAVGRIIADSVDKLNTGSILFEGCRRISQGMQIRLDVSKLESYSFYPGQVVALRGENSDGKHFTALEVLDPTQMVRAASSKDTLLEIAERQKEPAKVITAAGPYTTSDNLLFEPLDDLISHINTTLPDVVIMIGPFLDITHPKIQSQDFEVPMVEENIENSGGTLDDYFKAVVVPKLNQINPETTVLVIPNVRDAATNHAAFPQQPLDRKALRLNKNFKCLSNPATFSLNDVVFAVNSVDAIKDIAATMTQHNPQHRGLFGAIDHILQSKSMYPVFPPPQKFNDEGLETTGTSIDVPFMGLAEFTAAMPDVLITPSVMKPLAEVSSSVVVVNPGLVAKKTGGGTFATLTIKPPSPNDEETQSHEVWNRARVDITKL